MSTSINSAQKFTCPVCMEEKTGEDFRCPNGHPMDKGCARKWALENPDNFCCPSCRKAMEASKILSSKEIETCRKNRKVHVQRQHETLLGDFLAAGQSQEQEYRSANFSQHSTSNDEAIARALNEDNAKTNWTGWAINTALFAGVYAFVRWSDGQRN